MQVGTDYCGVQGGKKDDLEKEGEERGGRKEGNKEEEGNLRTERKDGYGALVGESNCKENGGISLPTRVERWPPSKCCS
jgi:hypothetical protein